MRKVYVVIGITLCVLAICVGIIRIDLARDREKIEIREKENLSEASVPKEHLLCNAHVDIEAEGIKNSIWTFKISLKNQSVSDSNFKSNAKEYKLNGQSYSTNTPVLSGIYSEPLYGLEQLIYDNHDDVYHTTRPKILYYKEDDQSFDKNYKGLIPVYREFVENQKESSEPIHLNEVMQYYPLGNTTIFSIPKFYGMNSDEDYLFEFSNSPVGRDSDIFKMLTEKFRIPVEKDEMIRFENLRADTSGADLVRVNNTDYYQMNCYNAITEDNCYFTFDTHTVLGNIVDTSELTEGYGIYQIPLVLPDLDKAWSKSKHPLQTEDLKCVYELNPEIKVLNLGLSEIKNQLALVFSNSHGESVFEEIDVNSGKVINEVILDEDISKVYQCKSYKNFAMVTYRESHMSVDKIAVFTRTKSGKLEKAFDCYIEEKDILSAIEDADFDGKKLITVQKEHYKEKEGPGCNACDFIISVYSEQGKIYQNSYTTGLTNQFMNKNNTNEHYDEICKEEAKKLNLMTNGKKKDDYQHYAIIREMRVHW